MKPGTVCYVVNMGPGAPELNGRVVTITRALGHGLYRFRPSVTTSGGLSTNYGQRRHLMPISAPTSRDYGSAGPGIGSPQVCSVAASARPRTGSPGADVV